MNLQLEADRGNGNGVHTCTYRESTVVATGRAPVGTHTVCRGTPASDRQSVHRVCGRSTGEGGQKGRHLPHASAHGAIHLRHRSPHLRRILPSSRPFQCMHSVITNPHFSFSSLPIPNHPPCARRHIVSIFISVLKMPNVFRRNHILLKVF